MTHETVTDYLIWMKQVSKVYGHKVNFKIMSNIVQAYDGSVIVGTYNETDKIGIIHERRSN